MTYSQEKPTGISGSGKVTLPAYSMLALTLVGIGVAVYVARGNYTGQPLWCPIIDGCNAVVNSPYSRVFGVTLRIMRSLTLRACDFVYSIARASLLLRENIFNHQERR
jgi:hypothetical protein